MNVPFSRGAGKTRPLRIIVDDISVEVVRKRIKHLHVRVYPPDGRVRVSVPLFVSTREIHHAISSRIEWIRRHQRRIEGLTYQGRYELIEGERHSVQGRPYTLAVVEHTGRAKIHVRDDGVLELRVPPGTSRDRRETVLNEWYRNLLRQALPPLVTAWEKRAGVTVAEVRIKKMRTRWGTCNIQSKRIWLNLELAKRSVGCLEFVLVHEIVHLLERNHTPRFYRLMDELLPEWRRYHEELNRIALTPE